MVNIGDEVKDNDIKDHDPQSQKDQAGLLLAEGIGLLILLLWGFPLAPAAGKQHDAQHGHQSRNDIGEEPGLGVGIFDVGDLCRDDDGQKENAQDGKYHTQDFFCLAFVQNHSFPHVLSVIESYRVGAGNPAGPADRVF